MKYHTVIPGRFLARPNRFIARVETENGIQTVHVKNTGRCRELLVPGATVYLEQAVNPARKTPYDLIAVEKGERLINMDAQAPNKVFSEWAAAGGFLRGVTAIHSEYVYGDSRLDFCLETKKGLHLVEVKGVTLEENGIVRFPDAPTERGVKHLHGLIRCVQEGFEAWAVFIIQMKGVKYFEPNRATHPEFAEALAQAAQAGVKLIALDCDVEKDSLNAADPVAIRL